MAFNQVPCATVRVLPTRTVPEIVGRTELLTAVTVPREGLVTANEPCNVEAVTCTVVTVPISAACTTYVGETALVIFTPSRFHWKLKVNA